MIADRCSSTDPRVHCAGRHDAALRGDFLWSWKAKGWIWCAFAEGRAMLWDRCPWCHERLPDLQAVYDRLREGIAEDEA